MIYGLGCDIVEVARISRVFDSERKLERCFTKKEREFLTGKPERIAGNFCAKEALAKALGTGFRGFALLDLEILRDELGRPFISADSWAALLKKLGISHPLKVHLSISHERRFTMAVCTLERF